MNRNGLVAGFSSGAGSGRLCTEDFEKTMEGSSDGTLTHTRVDVVLFKAMMR
jgi:hypothetical protein